MAVNTYSRAVTFAFLCIVSVVFGQGYQIPNVMIRPLKPSGITVSIPDFPNINFFEFQGNINKGIEFGDVGDISIEVSKKKNGFWTGEDESTELKIGDIIYYYIHVGIKGQKGYDTINLSYTVTELYDSRESLPSATPRPATPRPAAPIPTDESKAEIIDNRFMPTSKCGKTATEVFSKSSGLSKIYCSNDIIFEDNFDTLNEDWWIIEQFIPLKPEYPFVSYQRLPNDKTVSVENGVLRIMPTLQENRPGFDSSAILSGTLDLSNGCTSINEFCVYKSSGAQILSPIISGRIRTNKTFAFKYGFVEIKAKVPQGDWLYPDILLETFVYPSGVDQYESGILRIAGALGNVMLTSGAQDIGNKVLYGGPIVNFKCRNDLLAKKISNTEWGNDFHVYSLRWEPEIITLFVDGEEWGRITPHSRSLKALLSNDTCEPPSGNLKSPLAPFDQLFGITLGVSAGGVSEFPDNIMSRGTTPKPWKNNERKAKVNFYNAKDSWFSTWTQPALLVDYIRVRAL